MDKDQAGKAKHILYCNCSGERITREMKQPVEDALKDASVRLTVLSDLCGLAALQKEKVANLFNPGQEYLVIGCFKRTMALLISQAGNSGIPENTLYLNLLEETTREALQKIHGFVAVANEQPEHTEISETSGWPSWYPVIDPARCTNCGQCADFCLFGVYEKSDSYPRVVYPQGCKNNCPACGRICPSTAIIFPKYQNGGAIGGADEVDEIAEQKRQAMDIEKFLGDDLYEALERRKVKRRSIIRDEAMKRAMTERENALGTNLLK